jgi:hypothetical protein
MMGGMTLAPACSAGVGGFGSGLGGFGAGGRLQRPKAKLERWLPRERSCKPATRGGRSTASSTSRYWQM